MATAGRADPKALSEHSCVSAGSQQEDREAPTSPRFSSLARRLQEQKRQLTPHESITDWPCQGGRHLLNSRTSPFQGSLMVNRDRSTGPSPTEDRAVKYQGTSHTWSPQERARVGHHQRTAKLSASSSHLHWEQIPTFIPTLSTITPSSRALGRHPALFPLFLSIPASPSRASRANPTAFHTVGTPR